MTERILFFDLEGLDPKRDLILEAAFIRVDLETLQIEYQSEWLRSFDHRIPTWWMSPEVVKMHTESGLIQALDRRALDVCGGDHVPESLDAWALGMTQGIKPGEMRIAGYSPHFDLEFLKHQAPLFASFLHHRMIDVTTMRAVLGSAGLWNPAKPKPEHRAMADCRAALSELRSMREMLARLNVAHADK